MKANQLQNTAKAIQTDMATLKQLHATKMAEISACISHTSQRILATVLSFGETAGLRKGAEKAEGFRKDRLDLYREKEGYDKCCASTFKDLQ